MLDLCQMVKDKFQLSWKMVSLVGVIFKHAKEDQKEAWRQICEGWYILSFYFIMPKCIAFYTLCILLKFFVKLEILYKCDLQHV